MTELVLDLTQLTEAAELHRYLHTVLVLPPYYGDNLDALYDVLSTLNETLTLHLQGGDAPTAPAWHRTLRALCEDAAQANPQLRLLLE